MKIAYLIGGVALPAAAYYGLMTNDSGTFSQEFEGDPMVLYSSVASSMPGNGSGSGHSSGFSGTGGSISALGSDAKLQANAEPGKFYEQIVMFDGKPATRMLIQFHDLGEGRTKVDGKIERLQNLAAGSEQPQFTPGAMSDMFDNQLAKMAAAGNTQALGGTANSMFTLAAFANHPGGIGGRTQQMFNDVAAQLESSDFTGKSGGMSNHATMGQSNNPSMGRPTQSSSHGSRGKKFGDPGYR